MGYWVAFLSSILQRYTASVCPIILYNKYIYYCILRFSGLNDDEELNDLPNLV
jgi:hypothetical protein